MLGITPMQFVALNEFEKYYRKKKNLGLVQIEKNQDIVIARELFLCWDTAKLGHISIQALSENLISFGLAMTRDDVSKLVMMLKSLKGQKSGQPIATDLAEEQIEIRQWVKIFEKDKFSENAIRIVKREC